MLEGIFYHCSSSSSSSSSYNYYYYYWSHALSSYGTEFIPWKVSLLDGYWPPEYVSSHKEYNLLMVCYSDVSWDLSDVVFSPLLDKAESTRDHWDSCCFSFHGFSISILRSLYFGSFSTVLKRCFFSYKWAGRSSSPCLLLPCLACLPWSLCLSGLACPRV